MSYVVRLFVWVFIWVVAVILQVSILNIESDASLMFYGAVVMSFMVLVDNTILHIFKSKGNNKDERHTNG